MPRGIKVIAIDESWLRLPAVIGQFNLRVARWRMTGMVCQRVVTHTLPVA